MATASRDKEGCKDQINQQDVRQIEVERPGGEDPGVYLYMALILRGRKTRWN